ncbi:DNA topoisomerase 2 SCDLUD_002934 [Saccharomycodes ludwigii]|uniref:DNA topoisomerase 2 n=1 Tax=Saccharomycodes ludwigii TaxID=36035 RepID=UPI001E888777|nr:hypothetical protein SCDLUD_002934 [Saccharomycodes ludwigii]KAH3901440.1 hypothetical protein SCDLUD_002934 [Saccharomycodes ludwigii]
MTISNGTGRNANQKSASEKYLKISQLEHILKRPDTYIGSVEMQEEKMWVYDDENECMIEREVKFVPGLFKIFDEILVNAADNKVRDPLMKRIDVTIDPEQNTISVKNDGQGIPIEIHDKENIYIPELIFGHLLTSSNYDDTEKKVVGGRNGYGAKLCNIFSTEFILETADPKNGHKYLQKWTDNMGVCGKPKITSYSAKKPSYTKVTFKPDLSRFGMEDLNKDIVGIMKRRVYDINGSVRDISVYLNGKCLKIRNFKNYVELYLKSLEKMKRIDNGENTEEALKVPTIIYERINERWEIAFAVSDISFQQISFVNSIATTSGGTHVNYLGDQLVKKIQMKLAKNKKVKPFQIKNNIFLFVNCLIENPAFTSQTKEQLTTRVKDFGSKCEITDAFVAKVMNTDLSTRIFDIADENDAKAMKKTDGTKKNRITEYPKLHDANRAGTKEGYKCTLLLTEGDSALSLAVAGLAVVGRDYYGCYPLRGKLLNVRDATADQVNRNAEIQAIKKIMGLQHRKKYENVSSLRYGHLMIMTDQDLDGSHIKGLIINFLESSFPGLLDIPGFLIEFITPIIKVTITKPRKQTIQFYTIPEYETWRAEEGTTCTWKYKYYKGLGTSTQQEIREYFSNLDRHLKTFDELKNDENELIDLAFSKKRADDRKEWLRQFEPGTYLDPTLEVIPIKDFINKELILFSLSDNIRSIPNIMDGLKPGQRKVIYGCFKRNLRQEIKVSQLANYVAGCTDYHHTEESLVQTTVGLAQDFVGSNNIYLLLPKGAFGTRATGGKDAAASRYIFTTLNKLSFKIFHPQDAPLLKYVLADEKKIEPEWYAPVIPMILVNGTEGIGTGWSTNIPPYNPLDIVKNIKKLLNDEEMDPMVPWFRGWTGSIQKIDSYRYKLYGKIEQVGENKLEITELPPKTWITNIKEHLLLGISGNDKIKPWIKDMEEQHGATIKFVITLTTEEFEKTRTIGFYERFKLTSILNLSNMVGFDSNGKIRKYDDPRDILTDFFYVRLELYQRRKDYFVEHLQWIVEKLSYQVKFIKMIIDRELTVNNKPRKQLMKELEELGFPRFDKDGHPHYDKVTEKIEELNSQNIRNEGEEEEEEEEENDEEVENNEENSTNDEGAFINGPQEKYGSFDYLLGMKLWSLTKEKYEKLLKEKKEKEVELEHLLGLTAKDLWNIDLHDFEEGYKKFIDYDNEVRNSIIPNKATKSKAKRTRKKDDDDDYGESKAKKRKKKGASIKKEEENFQRFVITPNPIENPKKKKLTTIQSKVKKESKVDNPEEKKPVTTKPVDSFFKKSNADEDSESKHETINLDTDEDAFSSKFKKISTIFDEVNNTKPSFNTVVSLSDNEEKQNEQEVSDEDDDVVIKPVKRRKSNKNESEPVEKKNVTPKRTYGNRRKQASIKAELEDLLSNGSDNDKNGEEEKEEEEVVNVPRTSRTRTSGRRNKGRVSYTITDDNDSFTLSNDDDDDSDESFHASD